ncbi:MULTISPECIES: ProQ/FINO family protein [unclassified Rhizobium]|jgi:sRNA-binding protein|uniref:ProQ/FINO family protein n=1 Tax=unclassified Rhizobium TaxID=2613769 RepID=UPI0006458CDA|nr:MULTISPECIES: ProQ/FINO family protein [unclassified Rhizobium]MBN8954575.1 ProQ/FINO family protein [Rhizobium tropici]OJY73365.1 MAG: ProQ/FINO family protein [Rhizobium sp. 60-20]RKD72346.1 ProQ/FINO family protein [Rhizobium sp. WW_1]
MEEPRTTNREPILATELDVKKAAAINTLLLRPIGILPVKAGDPIRPFALGLWNEIRPLLKPDVPVMSLRRSTSAFLHSKRYYHACAQQGSMRHDLDGNPVEPLSDEDRLAAHQRLATLRQTQAQAKATVQHEEPPAPPVLSKAELIRASLLGRRSDRAAR